jgi:2'-5' RNA ligase
VRVFIAAVLPDEMRKQINTLVEEFRSPNQSIKWVREENVHITLNFLGEVADGNIEELAGIIGKALTGMSPFFVEVGGISAFPSPERPRVLWIGVDDPKQGLKKAYSAIYDALEHSALEVHRETKEYTPHITIGRIKGRFDRNIVQILHSYQDRRFGGYQVKETVLFRSILHPEGPRYVPVHTFLLRS